MNMSVTRLRNVFVLPLLRTKFTRDNHPRPRRDSKPQPQKARDRKCTPIGSGRQEMTNYMDLSSCNNSKRPLDGQHFCAIFWHSNAEGLPTRFNKTINQVVQQLVVVLT
jgi:hypothetical protein